MEKEKIKVIGKKNGKIVDLTNIATSLIDLANEMANADEVLNRNVVKIGNGAHINIPLKHLGKGAKIIIKKLEEKEKV